MTWLSRLLPQSPSQHPANRNHRTRQAQRRRRMATLETLEGRTLLSNVTVSFPTPSSPLIITGDTSNDNFIITELPNGRVTVAPGTVQFVPGAVVAPSTINGSLKSFTTSSAVTSITVNLPGTTNFDFVTLNGAGKTTPTTVKNVTVTATGANLTFTANKVDDSGALVVSDTMTSAVNAVLTATVDNSSFGTLSITQTGGGPNRSYVELGNDNIPASVLVSEGNANGDLITLNSGNLFGTTTLLQGNGGPTNSNSLGNSDTVSVGSGSYKNLTVEQLLNGTKNTITVSPGIVISPVNPTTSTVVDGVTIVPQGVTTSQGNGAGDVTTISGVTTSTPLPNLPLPTGIGWSNIKVGQGNGSVGLVINPNGGVNDFASVSGSTVPGNISITQTDLATNSPMYNTAQISGDTAGSTNSTGTISISQGNAGGTIKAPFTLGDQATVTLSKATGNITTTQGTGSNDSATVSSSTAGGNVLITQSDVAANPAGDSATISGDTVSGSVIITQGSASGDTATISSVSTTTGGVTTTVPTTVGGSITINQGSGSGDTATVKGATVGGSVTITQSDVAANPAGDKATISGAHGRQCTSSPRAARAVMRLWCKVALATTSPSPRAIMSKYRTAPQSLPMSPRSMPLQSPTTSPSNRALAPVPPPTPATTSRPSVSIILVRSVVAPRLLAKSRSVVPRRSTSSTPTTRSFWGFPSTPRAHRQSHSPPSGWMSSLAAVAAHWSWPRTRPSTSGLWVSSAPSTPSRAADPAIPTSTVAATAESPSTQLTSTLDTDASRKATLHTPPRGGRVADRPGNPRPVFFLRNPSPATTGSGRPAVSKSEAEFERAWRHGRARLPPGRHPLGRPPVVG